MEFPGFPTNSFDFHFEEVGPALAGLVMRDVVGTPRTGIFPSRPDLIKASSGWDVQVAPLVVVRAVGRKVLLGGSDENLFLQVEPAPAANARLDVVWARAANIGGGEAEGAVGITTGTPASVPSRPRIPEGAEEIGTIRVAASNSNVGQATITHTFQQTVASGGVIPFRSTAERDAFQATQGTLCEINGTFYKRHNGSWVVLVPAPEALPKVARGTVSRRNVAAGGVTNVNVSFPNGRFTSAPNVQVTVWGDARDTTVSVDNITKDGCVVRLGSLSIVTRSIGAQWRAESA